MCTKNLFLIKLTGIFLLTSLLMNAQEQSKITITSIGFSLGPEINSLSTANTIGIEETKSKIGLAIGFNLLWKIGNNTSFKSGIGFGIKKFEHKHSDLVFGSDIGSTGIISKSRMESKISFTELQLPLILQFQLGESNFFATAGIEITYPISNNSERIIYLGNGSIDKLGNFTKNSLNYAPQLSLGYNLPVSDKFSLTLEALIKYYMKAYIVPESHLINYGLCAGLNFGL
jgi:hypothetical protein